MAKNRKGQRKEQIDGIIQNGEIVNLDSPDGAKQLHEKITNSKEPQVITYKYNDEIAVGMVVPRNHPTSFEYLRDVRDYNDFNANIKRQIELSRKLYIWEGPIGTAIDMLCDFASGPVKIERIKNEKARKIIDFFAREVNRGYNNITTGLMALNHVVVFNYFVDGNVFLYNKWFKVKYGSRENEIARLPMLVVPIDPLLIDIPSQSINFGNKVIRIDLSKMLHGSGSWNFSIKQDDLLKLLPLKIRRRIKKGDRYLELSADEIYHIKRRGTSFGAWGVPYLTRLFNPIASKRRLRALDDDTTEGIINMITIFKIGDPKVPATLHPSRIQKFRSLLANPSASLTLAWSYDIDVLQVGPKGEILNFSDKYKQSNYDIITALGVPASLITGQMDRSSDVWLALNMLFTKLSTYKHEFAEYIRYLINRILQENGFTDENPIVRMPSSKIKQQDIRNQILSLWDRGLLSLQTAIEEAGYDFDAELHKRKEEHKEQLADVFVRPDLPFSSPSGKPAERKTIEKESKIEKEQTKQETIKEKSTGDYKTLFQLVDELKADHYSQIKNDPSNYKTIFENFVSSLINILHQAGYFEHEYEDLYYIDDPSEPSYAERQMDEVIKTFYKIINKKN